MTREAQNKIFSGTVISAALLFAVLASTLLVLPLAPARAIDFSEAEAKAAALRPADLEAARKEAERAGAPGTRSITGPSPESSNVSCGGFTDVTCGALKFLNYLTDWIFYLPFQLAETFFSIALSFNLDPFAPGGMIGLVTESGFPVALGAANIFFVLILLWIAIATIFDFEPYTARQLLPKLIIAALLINFSLPIGRSIIVLSNGIGRVFYDNLIENSGSIHGAVQKVFNVEAIQRGFLESPLNAYCSPKESPAECTKRIYENIRGETASGGSISAAECERVASQKGRYGAPGAGPSSTVVVPADCEKILAQAHLEVQKATGNVYNLQAMMIGVKVLVYPVAIFVIFAAAILLTIRIISLSFVLVLGPFAFLFLILPATRNLWSMWWDRLFKWSFFLPAFLFFFWLTFSVVKGIPDAFFVAQAGSEKTLNVWAAMAAYLFGAAFMIGSLMVSNYLGIKGAGTVTGWGRKMSGAAGKWTKGTGKIIGGGIAGAALGSGIGRAIASRRYSRWALRPVEAAAAAGQKVQDERAKNALKRRAMAFKASPDYRWALMQGMADSEQADFIRELKPHQLKQVMNIANERQRMRLYQNMGKFDLEDQVRDAAPDVTSAVEMETQTHRSDPRFQDAFNSWVGGASKQELQKRIQPQDIRANINLQTAIKTEGIVDIEDFKTMGNSRETAQAMRDFVAAVGSGSVTNGLDQLALTNRSLVEKIRSSPGVAIKLERGIALGKKAPKRPEEPTPPEPPPAAPGGAGTVV